MRASRVSAAGLIALLALGAKCADDKIPLGIEATGPSAPRSPGPQAPRGSGPGTLSGGGANSVATVAIAPSSLSMVVGDSVRVFAAAVDLNGQGVTGVTFTWTSSDTRVVRVREDPAQAGVAIVTAVGVGSATVSVAAGSASATAVVSVRAQP